MGLRQRITLVVISLALAMALPTGSSEALTVDPAPLEVLLQEASLGVRGVVARVTPERVPGHARRVRSRVLVLIDDALWARDDAAAAQAALGVVEIVLPGGSLGGFTTIVPGVPQLRPGDRALLLLEPVLGEWMPLGYTLGILPAGTTLGPGPAPGTPTVLP